MAKTGAKKVTRDDGSQVSVNLYDNFANSTQTFDAIGAFTVRGGDVVLLGRHGERDHIYPLERVDREYNLINALAIKLCRMGVRGWDELADIAEDFTRKVREAVDYRHAHNIPVPQVALDLLAKHPVENKPHITVDKPL